MGNAPTKGQHHHKNRGNKKYVHWDQAVPPWPPGKPHLVPGTPNTQPDVVTIRWDPPPEDGGAPITGYVVEHRKAGSPHWVRATTDLVLAPELRLSGLEPGWRYQFRVTAENAADLLSDPGELSQPLTVTRAYRPASMSPQFSLELRDTIALENDKAEFVVHFHGIPTPKIAWFKDSFEIFSSRRMRVTVENDVSSLLIHQTAFTDEGEYKCSATNRAGHIITKAKLRLEAPPRIRIPRQYEDGLIFEKEEVIRLKVSVGGRPLPRSTWYHNGEQIPFGGRYEVTNTDRSSGLRISEARRADRGEYQVRATSRLGEDIVSFLVTVTDRPMPPGRANVVTASGRSVTLSWTEPSDDGGCKIGNYIVEYYRLGWNVWLKAATCRHLTTTMGDLIEGSEYKFRVKAENPYGVSDPSAESDVVFIPDPKRGLLERPARTGSRTDIPVPEEPAEKKREHKRSKDKETQETKKKKESSSKSGKETVDRHKLKSELMERLEERRSVIQHEMSDLTRRKNNENYEKRSVEPREYMPEIVKSQRRSSTEEMEVEDAPIQPSQSLGSEKSVKASLQFSVAKRRDSSGEHDSGVSEGSFSEGKQSFTSPLLPREDDSLLLHGSSELMLVLLPETRNALGERDPDRNSEFDIFGDSGVPPPMSLSAPELGSGEPLMIPPLRNAISSTELLHEQAMARVYQAIAAEEAEKTRQRKEMVDRRSAEAEEVSSRPLAKTPQELTWHQRKQRKLQDRRDVFEDAPYNKGSSPQPEVNRGKTLNRKPPNEEEEYYIKRASPETDVKQKSTLNREGPMRLSTDEDEEEARYAKRASLQPEANRKEPVSLFTEADEEELFERIRKKTSTGTEENKPGSIIRRREEEMMKTAKKIEMEEEEILPEDEEIEEEEELEDEEYYGNEELDEEESEEEDESEFDEEEEMYKSMEEEEETYHPSSAVPRRIQRFAEEEEDTYHPRSMLPKASSTEARTLERQHTPRPIIGGAAVSTKSILKQNSRFQDDLDNMVERRQGILSRDLERSPPKSFRENLPKEFMPSFISDRSSHSPSPGRETESPEALEPEIEERQQVEEIRNKVNRIFIAARETAPKPDLPKPQPHTSIAEAAKPQPHNSLAGPEKPITRVTAPVVPTEEPTISAGEPVISAAEAARQKRMLIRKVSIEEDTEASKVVADYYGDIIRDHARPKKPVRRYLNTAEMKAAAANRSPSQSSAPTPDPPASPTPEPESEPEPEVTEQEQTVRTEKSAYERYTAPVQSRPPTPRRKSRTPDLVLIRQSSKDRSRMPSTERFASEMSKQFPELAHRFSSDQKQPEKSENLLPVTSNKEQQLQVVERKWRSIFSYLADVAMFLVACWLYVFKDERLAIPILVLMVYRQLHEAIKRRLPKLPQLPWKRSS